MCFQGFLHTFILCEIQSFLMANVLCVSIFGNCGRKKWEVMWEVKKLGAKPSFFTLCVVFVNYYCLVFRVPADAVSKRLCQIGDVRERFARRDDAARQRPFLSHEQIYL